MTDITITEADYQAGEALARQLGLFSMRRSITFVEPFARHRLSAIEEAAQIAEKHGTRWVAKDIRKMREG